MGGTRWSDDEYIARASYRTSAKVKTFAYTSAIESGKAKAEAHETLDPKKFKSGVRECRDSDTHPITTPVAIGLDVTGSMKSVPQLIQQKLPKLMGMLQRRSYVDGPSICMAGIGDVDYDKVPMQIGQFESGIEIENDITNLYLEGGGGGNQFESYELFLYFLARCVKADHFEKRNKKGYAFIICDESLTGTVSAARVNKVFGTSINQDIDSKQLVEEVQKNWNLFVIVPNMTSHYSSDTMKKLWKECLGQNVLLLDDPSCITEFIASTIGMVEGTVDVDDIVTDLKSMNTEGTIIDSLSRGLVAVKSSGTSIKKIVDNGATGLTTL